MPASMEVATKNMQNYIRRLNYQRKKQGLSNARYVYVTECSEKDAGIITSLWMAMWIWTRLKRSGILEKEMKSEGFRGMKRSGRNGKVHHEREKQERQVSKDMVCIKGTAETERKVNHYKTNRRMWTGS